MIHGVKPINLNTMVQISTQNRCLILIVIIEVD